MAADPHVVSDRNRPDFCFRRSAIFEPRLRIRWMSVRIEHPDASRDSAPPPDCNALADGERAVVPDARSTAYGQRWPLGVSRGEREAALAVDEDIVTNDQIAATLHPVHEDVGAQPAAVAPAVRLEQRLRDEHSPEPVGHASPEKEGAQKDSGHRLRHRQCKCVPTSSKRSRAACQPMIGDGQELSKTRLRCCHRIKNTCVFIGRSGSHNRRLHPADRIAR